MLSLPPALYKVGNPPRLTIPPCGRLLHARFTLRKSIGTTVTGHWLWSEGSGEMRSALSIDSFLQLLAVHGVSFLLRHSECSGRLHGARMALFVRGGRSTLPVQCYWGTSAYQSVQDALLRRQHCLVTAGDKAA